MKGGGGRDRTTEAEVGVMWPQAKEHLEPPGAERDKEQVSP